MEQLYQYKKWQVKRIDERSRSALQPRGFFFWHSDFWQLSVFISSYVHVKVTTFAVTKWISTVYSGYYLGSVHTQGHVKASAFYKKRTDTFDHPGLPGFRSSARFFFKLLSLSTSSYAYVNRYMHCEKLVTVSQQLKRLLHACCTRVQFAWESIELKGRAKFMSSLIHPSTFS